MDNNKGFSIVELIVVITIVSFLSLSIFQLYFSIVKGISHYRERATVSSLANNYMEIARNMSYDNLGTINGNPAGNLPDAANPLTVTVDRYNYQVYYVITTISNDPVGDPAAQNYKQVKLYVKELSSNTINTFVTWIASSSIFQGFVGALNIKAYNSLGGPLAGINIHIVNNTVAPSIDLCRITDINGAWNEIGVPCSSTAGGSCGAAGLSDYHITANDSACPSYNANYSTDRTYTATETSPSTPTPTDATVYYKQATYLDFQIDKLSNLTLTTIDGANPDEDGNCLPVAGIGLEVRGSKKIGVAPSLYKYDKNFTSNASGQISLSGIEWDTYTPALLGATNMIYGSSPDAVPFSVKADTTQTENLIIGPYTENSLLVTVIDPSKNPTEAGYYINGATVSLTDASDNTINRATGSVLSCNGSSLTPGQTMFALDSVENPYQLTVSADGFQPNTISGLNINGYMAKSVALVQTGTYQIRHKIIASISTSGGTISPSGNQLVNDGDDQAFTITAGVGNTIANILVDGVSQGTDYNSPYLYNFTNVTEDHTISASFSSVSPTTCTPAGSTRKCPDIVTGPGTQTCQTTLVWGPCIVAGTYTCMISDSGGSRNWNDPLSWKHDDPVPANNCNGTFPQNGDNVTASSTSGNLIVNVATANLNSFDLTNYTNTLSGSQYIAIAPASGTIAIAFGAGMTRTWTGYFNILPTTGTTINFTTNGKTVPYIYVNGGGSGTIQQQDDITTSGHGFVFRSNGATWNTNNHNIALANPTYFYAYNGAVFTGGTSVISATGITSNFYIQTSATNPLYDLSVAGAGINAAIQILAPLTATHSLTLSGTNNTTQRLLVASYTLGTQVRLTAPNTGGANYSNVDFRDIDLFSSAGGSINLKNITGLSGDCGNNNSEHARFTDPTTQHFTDTSGDGKWSTATNWTSRVPLCQDTAIMDKNFVAGKTVTIDVVSTGSVDWSGATLGGVLTWAFGNLYPQIYGSLTLKNGMALSSGNYIAMMGRNAYTLATDGVTVTGGIMFNMGYGTGFGTGSVAIQDDLTLGRPFYMYSGTVTNPNNSTIRLSSFQKNGGALTMCNGSCTWYLSNTSTSAITPWSTGGTAAQLITTGSTIDISNNAAAAATDTLTLGGLTYNNLTIHGDAGQKSISLTGNNIFNGIVSITDGSKNISITGNNTFANLAITGKKTISFTQLTNQTITNFSANGSDSNNLVTLRSGSSGTGNPSGSTCPNYAFTLTKAGGGTVNTSDYLSIQDSHAMPNDSLTWHAGANSVDVQDSGVECNTGWLFP